MTNNKAKKTKSAADGNRSCNIARFFLLQGQHGQDAGDHDGEGSDDGARGRGSAAEGGQRVGVVPAAAIDDTVARVINCENTNDADAASLELRNVKGATV